jgi:hypothetical protein
MRKKISKVKPDRFQNLSGLNRAFKIIIRKALRLSALAAKEYGNYDTRSN